MPLGWSRIIPVKEFFRVNIKFLMSMKILELVGKGDKIFIIYLYSVFLEIFS